MHKTLLLIFSLIASGFSFSALSLPIPFHVKAGEISNPLRGVGSANGGMSQDELSLLSVETKSSGLTEKISISYGDFFGKPLKGTPGFFQVALDRDGRRIAIDLSQITRTGIDPSQLKKVLSKSKYVLSSDMTMDPNEQSTNLTFLLNSSVELRVSTENGARSKVILDIKGLTQ